MVRSTCLLALLACTAMLVHGAPVALSSSSSSSHDTKTPSDEKILDKRTTCDPGYVEVPMVGCLPEAANALRNIFDPNPPPGNTGAVDASAANPDPMAASGQNTAAPPLRKRCDPRSIDLLGYCLGPL